MKTNWIIKNLLLAALFVVVVMVGAAVGLRLLTRHGQTVTAPDFTGLGVEEARELASQEQVAVTVVDSVFVNRLPGGVVYRQAPKAGATVKRGRNIFLTINSVVPRKVVMPNLYGYSVTEACAELRNRGLTTGRLQYVRDIATNNVLGQSCYGREVKAGDLVVAGSPIDLKVGMNGDNNQTLVPNLVGMRMVMAQDALLDRYLNVGRVRYDSAIRSYADSVSALVYKQSDPAGTSRTLGSRVDLYLTLDPDKLPKQP